MTSIKPYNFKYIKSKACPWFMYPSTKFDIVYGFLRYKECQDKGECIGKGDRNNDSANANGGYLKPFEKTDDHICALSYRPIVVKFSRCHKYQSRNNHQELNPSSIIKYIKANKSIISPLDSGKCLGIMNSNAKKSRLTPNAFNSSKNNQKWEIRTMFLNGKKLTVPSNKARNENKILGIHSIADSTEDSEKKTILSRLCVWPNNNSTTHNGLLLEPLSNFLLSRWTRPCWTALQLLCIGPPYPSIITACHYYIVMYRKNILLNKVIFINDISIIFNCLNNNNKKDIDNDI
ncbi:hypothetical protein H8356DRAFT_1363710 [Neocallimastix lanati (nom. inval.)]|nr:hypothetical protein H8356DRAFT_1363710 [Neocallimastix sp. JGI-2020a]